MYLDKKKAINILIGYIKHAKDTKAMLIERTEFSIYILGYLEALYVLKVIDDKEFKYYKDIVEGNKYIEYYEYE